MRNPSTAIKTNSFTPGFGWNASAGRYTDLKTGRFVKASVIRDAVDATITKSSERIRALTQSLMDGRLNLQSWEIQTAQELKILHLANQVAALGGFSNVDNKSLSRLESILAKQFAYLHRFATQISDGSQKINGSLLSRINLYVHAARATYEAERTIVMREAGYLYEISILHSRDSCQGCLGESQKDWQPIGTLIPIGERDCLTRCHCTLDYRK